MEAVAWHFVLGGTLKLFNNMRVDWPFVLANVIHVLSLAVCSNYHWLVILWRAYVCVVDVLGLCVCVCVSHATGYTLT